jgi:uncharacterized protein
MVDVTPLLRPDQKIIQSYAGGRFKISGQVYDHALIVGTDFVRDWTPPAELDPAEFASLAKDIDVLLIGTGASATVMLPALRQKFREQGLHVDVMDTGAACRTFNVLTAEGRRVAAALIPLKA